MFGVRNDGATFGIEEIWASNALKFSYTAPVEYDAHLYGFQRGFLTCVDLESGRPVWKSRSPGGSNLILVNGRLVIFGNDGSVVVAEPSADGYSELARLPALDRGAYTAPAFGEGLILIRNHEEIAAVRMREAGMEVAECEGGDSV